MNENIINEIENDLADLDYITEGDEDTMIIVDEDGGKIIAW